jgi:tRNA pseudouridine55 synthase
MESFNGWLNLYKPKGISSAKAVAIIKKKLPKKTKIGHAGTLDLEAEGILPIATGRATKLVKYTQDARKEYLFEVKFGSQTDTADASGEIIKSCEYIPLEEEAKEVCTKFIGKIKQTPPAYSALKIDGKRAYDLARAGQEVNLKEREIEIYSLKLDSYNSQTQSATYIAECSKGTYIRTLAEDISLSLKSLGFVLLLRRRKVGIFNISNSLEMSALEKLDSESIFEFLFKMEVVLDGIPVLDVDADIAKMIIYGQKAKLDVKDSEQIWLRFNGEILAIGGVKAGYFDSARVLKVELD